MSSWTVLTLHGRQSKNYAFSRADDHDRWDATADIYATARADDRIRTCTAGNSCVYARFDRNSLDGAEGLLSDYAPMVDDAVILEANDTTDTGTAYYYPNPTRDDAYCSHRYAETQGADGTHVGQIALAVMTAKHGLIAADPFHDDIGRLDDMCEDDGQDLTTLDEVYNR